MFMINTAKNMFKREDYSESEEEKEYSDSEEEILDDYFEGKSQINKNTFFVKIKPQGTKLIKRWRKNRNINDEFAEKAAMIQEEFYRNDGGYIFDCAISLCKIRNEHQYYIIDGQHRFSIYNRVENKNDRPSLPCTIYIVEDESKISDLFIRINTRVALDLDEEKKNQKKQDMLKYAMKETFENKAIIDIFGRNRPKISENKFFEKIKNTRCFKELEFQQITDKLVVINDGIQNMNLSYIRKYKIRESSYVKAQKCGFYLGLDKEMRWMKDLQ